MLQDPSNNLDGIFLILCLSPTISKEQTEYHFQMVVSNKIIVKFEIYQILYVNGYSLFINCVYLSGFVFSLVMRRQLIKSPTHV